MNNVATNKKKHKRNLNSHYYVDKKQSEIDSYTRLYSYGILMQANCRDSKILEVQAI